MPRQPSRRDDQPFTVNQRRDLIRARNPRGLPKLHLDALASKLKRHRWQVSARRDSGRLRWAHRYIGIDVPFVLPSAGPCFCLVLHICAQSCVMYAYIRLERSHTPPKIVLA